MLTPAGNAAAASAIRAVGFGAGFYDRTLAGIAELDSPPLLVGAAFDAQLLEAIERAGSGSRGAA